MVYCPWTLYLQGEITHSLYFAVGSPRNRGPIWWPGCPALLTGRPWERRPPCLLAKLQPIQPTHCNGGLLRFFFFKKEREGGKCIPKAQHIISPLRFVLLWPLNGEGGMPSFIHERLIVCLFVSCKSLPVEAQVYNGNLAPLTVLVVGNCYEITVILPLS